MNDLNDMNRRFKVPGVAALDAGLGGLPRVVITAAHAEAHLYLHGAHITHFQTRDQKQLLFLSEKSHFASDKPIRGGVPICFPWFGPKAGDAAAPIHGFARLLSWDLIEIKQLPDQSVNVVLELNSSDRTRDHWPFDFRARYQVNVGRALELTLRVTNKSASPFTFEEALHTYFAIGEVRSARVEGLSGKRYIDKVDGAKEKTQDGPIRFAGEIDRVYLDTVDPVTIHDPTSSRQITVHKAGSDATVAWNPWIDKAKAMADFGDEEWPRMICAETANAVKHAVNLSPGATHEMRAVIEASAL